MTSTPAASPAATADTSVWISRFVPSEVNHAVSAAWLHRELASGAILAAPTLLLVEVASAITRRSGNAALAAQIVQSLESDPQLLFVPLDQGLIRRAYTAAIGLHLRAADAVYAATAQQLGVPLYSWDQEHVTRAGAQNPTV